MCLESREHIEVTEGADLTFDTLSIMGFDHEIAT